MIKRRALAASYSALVLAYLGFILYFLTLRPGSPSGNQAVIWAVTGFASGGMMMMAVYMVTLYLFRRGEKAALYFALFCVGTGIRFFVMEGSLTLMGLLPGVTYGMALMIRYPAIGLQIIGAASFILEIFAAPKRRKLLSINVAVAIGYIAAAVITSGGNYISSVNFGLLFLTIPIEAYCIYTITKSAELRRNRLNIVYLASYLVFVVTTVFAALLIDTVPHLTVISSTVFVVAHIVLLSDRYARAIRDVEETNENLERIVDERTGDLRNAGDAMRELVSNISHDLKTPLTVMSVNLQNLSKRIQATGDAENLRHVDVAYNKCRDLQRLIQNMFEASSMETGQSLYERKRASLRELLIQAREKYGGFLEGEGLFLNIDYNEDAEIMVDPQRVWSVFDNIIYNAVRYTEKGGDITITAEAGESTVNIAVMDTGCGIAAEHLPRIFERFYKASPGRGGGDSGLGLYIVKSVMEGIGGSVRAQSEPGKGTSIILTFRRWML